MSAVNNTKDLIQVTNGSLTRRIPAREAQEARRLGRCGKCFNKNWLSAKQDVPHFGSLTGREIRNLFISLSIITTVAVVILFRYAFSNID